MKPAPRKKRFQFPLYMLMMLVTVVALALAPASYFMRADLSDRRTRMFALGFMIAGPMLMVIILNIMYHLVRRMKR